MTIGTWEDEETAERVSRGVSATFLPVSNPRGKINLGALPRARDISDSKACTTTSYWHLAK